MLFDVLIPSCYLHSLQIEENEISAKATPNPDETILFFKIDKNNKKESPLHKIGLKGEICDGLVYYYQYDKKMGELQRTICLVELKSSNVDDAVNQIINTYKFLRDTLKDYDHRPYVYKAYIRMGKCSHSNRVAYKEKLMDYFKQENCEILENGDISDFLRRNKRIKNK